MEDVEDVDIEGDGMFKYILIELTKTMDEKTKTKIIVRGYKWAEYHGMC